MSMQFWFEFASTYSYPAAMRIAHKAARRGVAIEWKPFLLGPIFAAQGWDDSPFNLYPAKGRYMWRDLERICEAQGLPFHRPSQFPRSGLLAPASPRRPKTSGGCPDLSAPSTRPTSLTTATSPTGQ